MVSKTCARCDGGGTVSCEICEGMGKYSEVPFDFGVFRDRECPRCGGSGELPCPACSGAGEVEV